MRLDKYPDEYYVLFRTALHKEVKIPFDSPADAKSFRQKLYGFRRSLQQSPEKDPVLAIASSAVSLVLDDNSVVLKPTTDPRILQRLREAIQDDNSPKA